MTEIRCTGRAVDRAITATCPNCARPDPATLAACRELTKGTGTP